ncbi:hypothetical protein [Virgibacillus doumboii]|uniref:hypothetical protein n=1 Tax=Virgibacillus doumboii TaxID=2697503 RepID=UPI0013DF4CAC|nr:hypothetical protein [Virgibacillus doumboii]
MNDQLWKTTQYTSFIVIILIGVFPLSLFSREKTPDGGWQYYFPNAFVQYGLATAVIVLLFLWMFSTFVRKDGEVSLKIARKSVIYLVFIGFWYLIIKWLI